MADVPLETLLRALKAAGEPTRLRILLLLEKGELNVKDLTQILGQSQPRLSRHLKLLAEAGLIERIRDGSWVFAHLSERGAGAAALRVLGLVDRTDAAVVRDRERAETVRRQREAVAQAYFATHAADWDHIRALHVAESEVEAAMAAALGDGPFDLLVDLGTGTGRALELFGARYRRGLGLDINQAMLAYAGSRLAARGLDHAQVRHGDLYDLSLPDGAADAVVMHQVLHFLSAPQEAIAEAARILAPGGRLLVVDFAPHDLEILRSGEAHERLGFPGPLVTQWLSDCGLEARDVRTLAPPVGTGQLTVLLWVAERPRAGREHPAASALPDTRRQLETIR